MPNISLEKYSCQFNPTSEFCGGICFAASWHVGTSFARSDFLWEMRCPSLRRLACCRPFTGSGLARHGRSASFGPASFCIWADRVWPAAVCRCGARWPDVKTPWFACFLRISSQNIVQMLTKQLDNHRINLYSHFDKSWRRREENKCRKYRGFPFIIKSSILSYRIFHLYNTHTLERYTINFQIHRFSFFV